MHSGAFTVNTERHLECFYDLQSERLTAAPCLASQTPFTLTLRLWDIYILEGEKVLNAMAYTTFKLHKSEYEARGAVEPSSGPGPAGLTLWMASPCASRSAASYPGVLHNASGEE